MVYCRVLGLRLIVRIGDLGLHKERPTWGGAFLRAPTPYLREFWRKPLFLPPFFGERERGWINSKISTSYFWDFLLRLVLMKNLINVYF